MRSIIALSVYAIVTNATATATENMTSEFPNTGKAALTAANAGEMIKEAEAQRIMSITKSGRLQDAALAAQNVHLDAAQEAIRAQALMDDWNAKYKLYLTEHYGTKSGIENKTVADVMKKIEADDQLALKDFHDKKALKAAAKIQYAEAARILSSAYEALAEAKKTFEISVQQQIAKIEKLDKAHKEAEKIVKEKRLDQRKQSSESNKAYSALRKMQGHNNWKNVYDAASAKASKEHEEAKKYAAAADRAHQAAVDERKKLDEKATATAKTI